MSRGKGEIAASALLVRPQCRQKSSLAENKQKYRLQVSWKAAKESHKTLQSCKITIETVSFSEYYPSSNPGKSR